MGETPMLLLGKTPVLLTKQEFPHFVPVGFWAAYNCLAAEGKELQTPKPCKVLPVFRDLWRGRFSKKIREKFASC
jgi:hypothetical protein